MRELSVIIALSLVPKANARDQGLAHEKLAEPGNIFKHALKAVPLHQVDLDATTLGKLVRPVIPVHISRHGISRPPLLSARYTRPVTPGSLPVHGMMGPCVLNSFDNFLARANGRRGQLDFGTDYESANAGERMSVTKNPLQVAGLDIRDLWDILRLTDEEYADNVTFCRKLQVQQETITEMVPKLMFPFAMGHYLRGVKDRSSGELLGFIDLSLQSDYSSTLDALKLRTIFERRFRFNSLSPYLMNLLIARKARCWA